MKAMIFAAGLGTRLKPYTDHHPKALVEVCGEPMLQRVITKLKAAGITEMVVNVHHFASQITDFLEGNDNFGVDIRISDETSCLLDTGGGILAARRWLEGDDFVVHNADILTDFDIRDFISFFNDSHNDAYLLVAKRETSRYLLFDPQMRMRGWTNIKTGQLRPDGIDPTGLSPLAFGGVHIISGDIFDDLAAFAGDRRVFSIIDYYVAACESHTFKGYMPNSDYMWHDIGKPESLKKAENELYKQV